MSWRLIGARLVSRSGGLQLEARQGGAGTAGQAVPPQHFGTHGSQFLRMHHFQGQDGLEQLPRGRISAAQKLHDFPIAVDGNALGD